MEYYRPEAIMQLMTSLDLDQYDDAEQDALLAWDEIPEGAHRFLTLYLPQNAPILEIGCGSGMLFGKYGITHAIEPARTRFTTARQKGAQKGIEVKRNVMECIDYPDAWFAGALMLNGFFQVRSDYEALIEVNRVLQPGGMFIFNLYTNDHVDAIQGRCFGAENYRRVLTQFGFDVRGIVAFNAGPRFVPAEQISTYFAARKVRPFDPRGLDLPQIVTRHAFRNYWRERDWRWYIDSEA